MINEFTGLILINGRVRVKGKEKACKNRLITNKYDPFSIKSISLSELIISFYLIISSFVGNIN